MLESRVHLVGAFLVLASTMAGCKSIGTAIPTSDSATSTPQFAAQSTIGAPDLSARPLIFFGPLMHPAGSLDFMSLFEDEAPWTRAAGHVQVFMLYGGWVAHFPWEGPEATDEELSTIIADLNRRGIAIGFEASPLVATEECGQGVEGFFGPEEGLLIARKLKNLGADVKFVQLDEPFYFGHIYSGINACHWPVEKIAEQVQTYIAAIKSVYPDVIIGDNEPLLSDVMPEDLIEWMDTFESESGSNLPFLHLDLDYSRTDWPEAAKNIEDAARKRGVEFGIFYMGDAGDATDEQWVDKAFDRARVYELIAGGKPDHVIFQSWHDHPDAVLPETGQDTFTSLINLYFRTRTRISLEADTQSKLITGSLLYSSNAPIGNEEIQLNMRTLDGSGLIAEHTISFTVPSRAVRSDVGFRINTECGCQGDADFYVYEVRYSEGGGANLVPNGDFSEGMAGWSAWGSGTVGLEPTEQGRALHVTAKHGQDAAINSRTFAVTPGAIYTLTFVAQIPPASTGSGYLEITFQDQNGEFTRERIMLAPAEVTIGTYTTSANGTFTAELPELPTGEIVLSAAFGGDETYWPAYASEAISSP